MRSRSWPVAIALLLVACGHGDFPTQPTPTPTPMTHIGLTLMFRYWDPLEHWAPPNAAGAVYMPAGAQKEECAYFTPPKGVTFSGSVTVTKVGTDAPWESDRFKAVVGAGRTCFGQWGDSWQKSPASIHTFAVDVTDSTGYHLKEAVSLHFWTPGVDEPR